MDKADQHTYTTTVIPYRGAWLEYETDNQGVFYVRIDKNRKLPITCLIRAMGVDTDAKIKELFGEDPLINATLEKDTCKTREESLLEGEYRALVKEFLQLEPCLTGRVESVPEQSCDPGTPKAEALMREAVMVFDEFLDLIQKPAQELQLRILALHEPGFLADSIGQHATFSYQEKAKLLAQLNPVRRLDMALRLLRHELEVLKLESEMQDKTREQIDRGQRDYYLREQMKVIRTELGEEDEEEEAMAYRSKIHALHLDQEVEEKLLKDVNRMAKQPFGSAEGAVLRNYLDAVLSGGAAVDGLPCQKPDRQVAPGAVISLRGMGKIRLAEVKGQTRKGRISVEIEKFK